MEPARFEHHPTKMPRLPWTRLREAAAEGRSIEVRGFELGQSTHEAAQLLSFAGYRFEGRVRFHRCVFRSFVDLAEARFDQTLHLTECEFRAGLKLHDAVVKGRCSLRGSTLCDDKNMWLDWRGLRTGADLRVQGGIAAAPIDLANARIGADLRLDGLHVEACGRTKEEVSERALTGETGLSPMAADMAGKALSLHGAKIEGHLLLKKFTLATGVAYRGALLGRRSQRTRLAGQCDMRTRVGGWVIFDNAAVDAGTDRKAIDMDSAEVRGTVHFIGGTRVTGSIDLRASVGGQVAFQGAAVDAGTETKALTMESAKVGGAVLFLAGTR
ncbi:MAG: pentapeptide repeat-containing protein, partial [Phycisphaerales bacterium]